MVHLPSKLGGWAPVFSAADRKLAESPAAADGLLLNANNQLQYATLALGSAMALFLYPHSVTGVLAPRGRDVLKRSMSALPAYSLLLGLLAFAAIGIGAPVPAAIMSIAAANLWTRDIHEEYTRWGPRRRRRPRRSSRRWWSNSVPCCSS